MENSLKCSPMEPTEAGSAGVSLGSDLSGNHLIDLEKDDIRYKAVKSIFLAGMDKNSKDAQVTSIRAISHATFSAKDRWNIFDMHCKAISKKHGGHYDIKRAWYGASKEVIAGVARYGFVHLETIKYGLSYGTGIYLTPVEHAIRSAVCSDVDQNGIKHMILCRVLLGNAEQVKPGSEQFYPSSEEFDSGVDNKEKPGLYVMWGTHMNTHIFPEFVVSFKVPPPLQEFWDGYNWKKGSIRRSRRPTAPLHDRIQKASALKQPAQVQSREAFNKMLVPSKGPTSSWMPFSQLITVLASLLPSSSVSTIRRLYGEYRAGKITRDNFVRQLRQVAGDKPIVAAIRFAQSKVSLLFKILVYHDCHYLSGCWGI
ncbi:putative inactive poly ADP-ribose polymerase [Nymphaea thermarum]|nr:putative inactive poly ADP-ribose polymerase [Nymphaea thermarum]